ncbi:hypothetical protein NC653_027982, partial [Populus alba x Populus x berolinensis]
MGNEEKTAAVHQEIKSMNQLPATSSYVSHRLRVLNKILQLLSIQVSIQEICAFLINFPSTASSFPRQIALTLLRQQPHQPSRPARDIEEVLMEAESSDEVESKSPAELIQFVETGSSVEGNVADAHETGGTALPVMDL